MLRKVWRCPHCDSRDLPVDCVTCNREMCEGCISYGEAGKVCGLCKDREDAVQRYKRYVAVVKINPLPFDEWYDKHG